MIKILSLFIMVLAFLGCSRMDVNVDYDESYDFKKVKAYTIDSAPENSKKTLFEGRVINALEYELGLKNYNKVTKNEADLIFVFYFTTKDKSDVQTSFGLSGFRGSRYGTGMMMSTTNTYEYTEGKLVIDALNPKTNKVLWRGIGVKELNEKDTPQQRTEAVNAAVKKIMEKFPTH